MLFGESLELGCQCAVSGLCPGLDGALLKALILVRDYAVQIKINGVAETLALWTRSERVVEGKEARLGLLVRELALAAFKFFAESKAIPFLQLFMNFPVGGQSQALSPSLHKIGLGGGASGVPLLPT